MVKVNLDPHLLLLLREIHYLSQEPFSAHLPAPARELLRNTNSASLRMLATRLETIVSKYNTVMHVMTEFEQPLFERCLAKIDDVSIGKGVRKILILVNIPIQVLLDLLLYEYSSKCV